MLCWTVSLQIGQALKQDVWRKAMEHETDAIERNGTWELVPHLVKQKVIEVKWVYKTKYRSDGSLNKHKARLVAKGYAHRGRASIMMIHLHLELGWRQSGLHLLLQARSGGLCTRWMLNQLSLMVISKRKCM